ncbi:filamentous hemagglutinin N-terminal domain-containing protein, partial [Mixta tenebrionis]
MNKLFYRIIFNKARGMLMVVAEITRSHRAGVSPASGSDRKAEVTLTARLATLAFGLLLAFAGCAPALAGVVADKSAPGKQQPQIINSASGITQINIQTPSAAGVSRNTYSQFDVDRRGVILNNSHRNVQTNLAGMVAANPNLAKGEAKIILNEVNSRNPSQLNGYIEVAGQKAQVVIANPSGIQCDGCGFINANRATLTTGTPQLSDGNLTGYRVNDGNITLTGKGLDSSAQDYTDIIARSVKVNAGIRARDLKITTGRNQVDAAHQLITALADDGSKKPGVALDVSALGGMYAGKIRLTGTEKGVGVHNAGEIGATAGNVVLTADGRIENNGHISSTGNAQIISHADISNSGGIHSQQQLTLSSDGALSNSGSLVSGGSLVAKASSLSSTRNSLLAAGVDSAGKLTQPGDLTLTASGQLSAHGQNLAGGLIQAKGQSIDISASQTAATSISLDAQNGALSTRDATVDAEQTLVARTATTLNNDGGSLTANKLTLSSQQLSNRSGTLAQLGEDDLSLTPTGKLDNYGGHIRSNGKNMTLSALTLDNRAGEITHAGKGDLFLSAARQLDNGEGTIQSAGHITSHSAAFNNEEGQLIAVQGLALKAASLNNHQGALASGGDMSLTVKNIINTGTMDTGGISSGGELTLVTSSLDNGAGLLLAGKSLTLLNTLLNNQSGQIVSQQALNLSTVGDLNNQQGLIQASGIALDTQGHALDNRDGTLYSLAALRVDSAGVDNQGGTVGAKGNGTLVARTLDNRNGGRIVSESAASVTVQTLQNQQGQIQSAGDLWLNLSGLLNNHEGLIRSGAVATVTAQKIDNSSTQGENQGIEGQTLTVTSDSLHNQNGSLLANNSLTIIANGLVNNVRGVISASQALLMKGSGLRLTNTEGIASAGSQLTLNADSLTGDGRLLSSGNMAIASRQAFSNQGSLIANRDLTLDVRGDVVNRGQILAGKALSLSGNHLSNLQNGEINAGTNRLTLSGTLSNTGLIDGGLTWLEANTLNNTGTGRIYGDSVGVNVTTFNNMAADGVAPVLAGRAQVNIGARTINNYTHALIYSDGTLATGGRLSGDGSVAGQVGEINNHSATIESAGDMQLNVDRLNNVNDRFATELVTVSVIDKLLYQWKGVIYDTADYNISLDKDETWIICIKGVTCHDSGSGDKFNEYRYTETIQETQVKESDPAKLLAGGNLTINGNKVYNENSEIVAGGTLAINAASVENRQAEGQRIVTDKGTLKHYYRKRHKGGDSPGIDTSDYAPPATIQTILLNPGRMDDNSQFNGSNKTIDAQGNLSADISAGGAGGVDAQINGSDKSPELPRPGTQFDVVAENGDEGTIIRTVTPDTRLPDNSLFNVKTDNNSSYLIETDARFTSNRQWLASDYMQEQLGIDQTMKRLGDGYYEQRLVREQIIALTGRRYLEGFSNDEEEYKALMDNGVAFSKQYNLRPGVALSAEQMAKLTKPLVWLVSSTVTLPDGRQQTVLVPKVYAPVKAGDLNASGALISGGNLVMNLTGDLANSGVLGGRQATVITAENILNNAGSIQGTQVNLTARNDLISIGGSLQGLDSLVANAGRDITITTTTRHAESENVSSRFSRTTLDKVASVSVVNEGGTLLLNAGRDVNLTAAQVVNEGNDSQTLIAARRDVNLNTVTTASRDDVAWNSDNTLHQAQRTETGVDIAGNGSVSLAAGQDINARAVSLNANDALALSAGRDIRIVSGENHSELDERHKETGNSSLFSKTTVTTRDAWSRDTAQASQLGGNSVTIDAGRDLLLRGSDVAGTQDVALRGGRAVTVTGAEESNQELHLTQQKKSGLSGTGGIGFSYGTQDVKVTDTLAATTHRGSTVGSVQGSLSIRAGGDLRVQGSELIAGQDMLLTGKNVVIETTRDSSTQTHTVEQKTSGLTLALSGTAGSALNTAVSTLREAKREGNDRVAALQGVRAALTGVGAAQAVALDGAQGAGSQNNNTVGVTLSYGSQKSVSEQRQSSSASRGSSVMAGRDLTIRSTEGDISIEGSQLQAGNNALLDASRDLILKSGENTSALTGRNESHGSTAGVGIGVGTGSWGLQVSAGVSQGRGHESGSGTTHSESGLTAGNNVTLASGRDTQLTGAQVSGGAVKVNAGRDLLLRSEQDRESYESKQQSVSAGGSVAVLGGGGSGSISMSREKMNSEYASVREQTGIAAGKGGFEIIAGRHTQLDGAVIASAAEADKNSLSTGTLGWSAIRNRAEYEVEQQSAGLSSGGGGRGEQFVGNMANSLLSGVKGGDSAGSVTQSAISAGSLTVRDAEQQRQDTAGLSRDTENANQVLEQIFDREKEQQRLKEAQLIGEIGSQAADIARTQEKIAAPEQANGENGQGTGGRVQQAIQAVTAAMQGLAGGNLAQALSGAAGPYLAEQIHRLAPDEASRAMAHAVVGAVTSWAAGNDAAAGAAGAVSGEVMGQLVMKQLYPGKTVGELTEAEKQTISALGTLAAGLAGGLAGGNTA